MSLSSLCLIMGKPPVGLLKALFYTEWLSSHTQCEARSFGNHGLVWAGEVAWWRHLIHKRDPDTVGRVVVIGSPYHHSQSLSWL